MQHSLLSPPTRFLKSAANPHSARVPCLSSPSRRSRARGRGDAGRRRMMVAVPGDKWNQRWFQGVRELGVPPVMIHRHWGTALARRPRFQSWCWRRVAAHAAVCRRCAAVNHAPPVAQSAARK